MQAWPYSDIMISPHPHRGIISFLSSGIIAMQLSLTFAVRPDGAFHQWREDPPRELSIALVADERFGRATGWIEAS